MSKPKSIHSLTLKLTDQEVQDLERVAHSTGATSQATIRVLIRDFLPLHVQRLAKLGGSQVTPSIVDNTTHGAALRAA